MKLTDLTPQQTELLNAFSIETPSWGLLILARALGLLPRICGKDPAREDSRCGHGASFHRPDAKRCLTYSVG